MPTRPPRKQVDDAVEALNSVRRDWLKRDGVTAVDVGFKIEDDKITDTVALRMHVRRKLPRDVLAAHEAATAKDDDKIAGFAVDVIEAEYSPANPPAVAARAPMLLAAEDVDRRSRVDPLIGGVSCGNPRVTAGTLGAIVFDRATGNPCILSNWHILAGSRAAAAGEEIWQPGRADGGSTADTVATLTRFRLDRDMDAGIARLNGRREWSRDLLELDPIGGIDEPVLGMRVRKSGRTTALTEGLIDGVSMTITINYGGGVVQTLDDQMHIVPRPPWPQVDYEVSMGGDSGSVWVNETNGRAVGLHFAGETSSAPSDENAVANRMTVVAEGLNFSFTPLFRPVPIDDDFWRRILRQNICRRFPQLCSPLPFPGILPQGAGAVPWGEGSREAPPSCPGCGGAAPGVSRGEAVDALIEEVLATLREQGVC